MCQFDLNVKHLLKFIPSNGIDRIDSQTNGDLLHSEVKRVALRPVTGHVTESGLEKGKHAAD